MIEEGREKEGELMLTSDGDRGAEVEPPSLVLEAVDEEDEVGESEEKLEESNGHD